MNRILLILLVAISGCGNKNQYDPARYYDAQRQDLLLTQIVTYIFEAPPLTSMKDRFKPEHSSFYSSKTRFFTLEKLYKAPDGTHYFYLIRPAPHPTEKRGVGGYFKVDDKFSLYDFREVFVTPMLPEADVKGRCSFLFDEMVKGTIEQYLLMPSYVQWPNEISYYDSTTFEWRLKPGINSVQ
ncbi:MAG: hypothetical protein K2U26_02830 [Cyclobacteriaceae bacterium]|nr:hypothetical protein [Cyclobacteriaceae bacterium]